MDKTNFKSKPNRLTRKKVTFYSLLLLGVVFLCVVVWQSFLYINPQARVDSTVYEPKKLPTGLSIKGTSLDIWSGRLWFAIGVGVDSPFPYAVNIRQDLGKHGSFINQEKDKGFGYTCSANQALSTCQAQSTKNGQQYILTINTYSQPSTQTEEYADFVKNNTHITIRVNTDSGHLVSAADWSDTIDSFAPTTLAGVGVNYYHPGP